MADRAGTAPSTAALLKRYLQMYWLKPFDAVNDTANAQALRAFPWEAPILEVGGGDGVFSFIMQGGEFEPAVDRFEQADTRRDGDMFDVYRPERPLRQRRRAQREYAVGVDLKWSHVMKSRATGLYRCLAVATPGALPFKAGAFKTVFLYFPHGLIERDDRLNYDRVLAEIRHVLAPDGVLLMTAMNDTVAQHFVCHSVAGSLARAGWPRASAYFARLDGGRFDEVAALGRSLDEWRAVLARAGFALVDARTQISPLAWRVYDVGTRPILRPLIRLMDRLGEAGPRPLVKRVATGIAFPFLLAFYYFSARPSVLRTARGRGVVFALHAKPLPGPSA